MANCCMITLIVRFKDQDSASWFYTWQDEHHREAQRKRQATPLGNSEQYVQDFDMLRQDDLTVEIGGWVRWALDNDAFISFVQEIVRAYKVQYLQCTYEEIGMELYGNWLYEDDTGRLVERSIPEDYVHEQQQKYDPECTGNDDAFEKIMNAIRSCPEEFMCIDEAIDLTEETDNETN